MLELNKPVIASHKKIQKKHLLLGFFLVFLVIAGFLAWDNFDFDMPPPVVPLALSKETKGETPIEPVEPFVPTPNIKQASREQEPTSHYLHNSTRTQELTNLLSDLEVKKVQLSILEIEQKLMTGVAAMQPPPVVQLPATGETPSAKLQIVSIEGVNGKLSATLATSLGFKTVKVGDTIDGKRVDHISVNSVIVKDNDGALNRLPFQED